MKSRDEVPAPARAAPDGEHKLDGGYGDAERAEALQWFVEARVAEAEKALGLQTPNDELRNYLAYLLWKTLRNSTHGRYRAHRDCRPCKWPCGRTSATARHP